MSAAVDVNEELAGRKEGSDSVELAIEENNGAETAPPPAGKRKRTAVQAFVSHVPVPEKEAKGLEFGVGRGTLLGELDVVQELMNKNRADHYVVLHRLLYKQQGNVTMRKKNVRRFNGFSFLPDSSEHQAKLRAITKLKSADRKAAMKLLGLKQSSTIEEFLAFLMSPSPAACRATPKKKSKTPAKSKPKSKTPSKRKSKSSKAVTSKTVSTDDEAQSDNSLSISDEEAEKEAAPPKKRRVSDIEGNEAKPGPSDSDLASSIKKLMGDVDIEEVSMKQAVSQVYGLYPDIDLSDRKSFIKNNIRKFIE